METRRRTHPYVAAIGPMVSKKNIHYTKGAQLTEMPPFLHTIMT